MRKNWRNWLQKTIHSRSPRRRKLILEVELLEDRSLLSQVTFVPMPAIASSIGGSDLTTTVGDINGDGHLDVISTSSSTFFQGNSMVTQHTVVWYENNGAPVPSFTPHTIAVSDSPIPWVGVGDIDGNGTLDVVLETGGQIYWYGNNGDGTVWTPHLVPGAQGDLSVWIADVLGNGHNDLILPYQNTITWWENVKGDGTVWTPHVISDQVTLPPPAAPTPPAILSNPSSAGNFASQSSMGSGLAMNVALANQSSVAVSVVWGMINILSVGDINGDGKLDVISSGDGSITWWQNPGTADGTWIRHTVYQGNGWGDVRMAFTSDINNDGKLDIISSGFGNVSWWENTAGDGSAWTRHVITNNDWNAQSITVGDINGDGHPDLFSFAPMSSTVTWYENDGTANPNFIPHTITFPSGAGTVSLGDLTGDGRLDAIVTTLFGSSSIDWYLNWDGQSPLPTSGSSTVPVSSAGSPSASLTFVNPFAPSSTGGSGYSDVDVSQGINPGIATNGKGQLNVSTPNQGTGVQLPAGIFQMTGFHFSVHVPSRFLGLEESVDFSSALSIVPPFDRR